MSGPALPLGRRGSSGRPPRPSQPSQERGPSRRALWTALVVSAAGVIVSIVLVRLHSQAHAGVASFCSISEFVNCDRVATSGYSVVLGLPVAAWGVVGFGTAAAFAGLGLGRRGPASTWAAGLLFLVACGAVAASLVLAGVSEFAIGALCLLCAGAWVLSVALLTAAARACRGPGLSASLRDALGALAARPGRTAAVALAAVIGIGAVAVAYPRYWERPRPKPATTTGAAGPAASAGGVPSGPAVVVEYSDYECPFCAKAHEETRGILRQRPDITIVRRQFPLDSSCNPALRRSVHPSACELARAGICAQAQGRFAQMDDALFRNQSERLPTMTVARRVGLDLDLFRACMTSPETERRLQADIAAAMRDGVKATPTYVVNGIARAGEFPSDLVPPAPGTARAP